MWGDDEKRKIYRGYISPTSLSVGGRRDMRGVGGPLLCIGDLLSDIGEGDSVDHHQQETPSSSSSIDNLQPSDLTGLFQVFEKPWNFLFSL